jgi:phage tail-like protein
MEEQIDQVDRIFDPEAVPGSLLSRLAGWLGVNVDESWSEEQLRRLLIAAPDLYRKRGTREEMEAIITIYTGEKPFIVEYFQYKYLQETLELKQLMTQLYGQDPYGFTVLVKQERVPTAAQASALQRLIDEEKPAFTDARLVILQPWIYMDMHSYLGINTYLSELSLLRLDNKAAMPFSSVIVDTKRDNQLDTHSRMELDARLK